MTQVSASQFVFGRLTGQNRRAGFQTICHTQDTLSEGDIVEIQRRIFNPTNDRQPVKRIFFRTPEESFVVTEIRTLHDRDEHNRGGGYVAHSFIFSAADFLVMGNNPFVAFNKLKFFATVDDALEKAADSGHINPVTAEIGPEDLPTGSTILAQVGSNQVLRTLLYLASRNLVKSRDRFTISFVGETTNLMQFLEQLHALLPPQLRACCTFDTVYGDGGPAGLPYWAIGSPSGNYRHPSLIEFDLANGQFVGEVAMECRTSFERWLASLGPECPPLDSDELRSIYDLCACLDGSQIEPEAVTRILPEWCATVRKSCRDRFAKRIWRRLRDDGLGKDMAARLFREKVASWAEQEASDQEVCYALAGRFPADLIGDGLEQCYLNAGVRSISPAERKQLGNFLGRDIRRPSGNRLISKERNLLLQAYYLAQTGQWDQFSNRVNRVNDETRERFLRWLANAHSLLVNGVRHVGHQHVFVGIQVSCRTHSQQALDCFLSILNLQPTEISSSGDFFRCQQIHASEPAKSLQWAAVLYEHSKKNALLGSVLGVSLATRRVVWNLL